MGSSNETKRLIFIISLRNGHWVTLCVTHCNKKFGAYYYDSLNGKENRSTFTTILKEELNMDESNIIFFNERTQDDRSNCEIFALEAAGRINYKLDEGVLLENIDPVLSEFKPIDKELRTLRDQLAQILNDDQTNNEFVITDSTPLGNNRSM